eukprot:392137_1
MNYKMFADQLCIALCTPKSYLYHTTKQHEIYYIIARIIRLYCPYVVLTKQISNKLDEFPVFNSSIDCITINNNKIYASISPYSSCQNNGFIKKGSHIYSLSLIDFKWSFITFIVETFVNSLWINNNKLYLCTNSYGLIQILLDKNTNYTMQIIEESCKGPMISGIYKHKHNYFYFFGYNNNTKQFGYYYSTNSKLIDLNFISIEN